MNDTAPTKTFAKPSLWTFLTQGAAAGALVYYLSLVVFLETTVPYYHFLVVAALPEFLARGLATGGVKGIVIWACTRVARHRLGWFLRSVIAVVVFQLVVRAWELIFPSPRNPEPEPLIWTIGSMAVIGLTHGLIIGSRLQPWRLLVRGSGTIGPKSATLAGLTGLVLRLGVLFLFLVFVLIFLSVLQTSQSREFTWIVLITIHLTLSLLAVFIKMKFWLLAALAVLLNTPVVILLREFQPEQLDRAQYVLIAYLTAWAMFLLARWRQTYRALSVFGEELRYYLID